MKPGRSEKASPNVILSSTARGREDENLRRFATVVRDSNDAITIQDFEGRITAWNHGAELMYGYSEAEALAMNIERLTAPGKVHEQKDFVRRLIAGEAITSFETQRVTKDGRILDVWMTVTKLVDKAGKPIGIASTERDTTALKREAEEAARMVTVVRDSNDAITIQDFEGRITAWNHGAELMYGYSEAEALRSNIDLLTTPDKVAEQKAFIRRLAAGEDVTSFETQRVTKDGRVLDVWMTVTRLMDDAGKPIGLASTERDITARKRKEEDLRRMATVVRDSNDAITIQDFEGRITAWNRGAELMYGYSEEEALAMSIERLTAPGKVHEQQDFVRRLVAGEAVTSLETQRVTKDGRILDVWMTVTKLVDKAGKPIGIASTERDITTLKREAEEASRMVTVVRDSNDAITIQDFGGRITAWNHGAELMYGYSEEEALAMNIERLTAPGKVDEQQDFVRRLVAGEAITSLETQRVTKDGRILDVWMTVTKLVDKAGKPIGIASTERDITALKREPEKLRETNDYLENLIGHANAPIVVWDPQFRITRFNGAFESLSGRRADEVVGNSIEILFPPALAADSMELIAKTQSGERWETVEIHIQHIGGDVRTVLWNSATLFATDGKTPTATIAQGVDITERNRALEEVHRLNAELEQRVVERTAQLDAANKELEAFSYSVSHDLRAPLRHVQGYVDMLGREAGGQLSENGQRYMQTITDASREMGVLIDDLLAFSRMGRAEVAETTVSLSGLGQECIQSLEMATRGRNIVWTLPQLPAVHADPAMLRLALTNLLSNAVKFTSPRDPAQIEIGSAGAEHGRLIFFVRDNGVGFDPQYIHKLFGVFQRLHRADEFEGTGIGLANVRRIIARHGGRTWAEGAVDKGATFYFTLRPSASTHPSG